MFKAAAVVMLVLIALAGGLLRLQAQESGEPAKGLVVAEQLCASCHAVRKGEAKSPNDRAPVFTAIASVPGLTALALHATLQSSHRTMPNIMLSADDQWNVVAYILSLQSN